MYDEIKQLAGKEKGPTSIILAGIHGDEKCGISAFKKILPNIKINKGTVLFVYGNPKAIKSNKRYIEKDLNRMFNTDNFFSKKEKQSYEYERAQYLKNYLNTADALLDIHASSIPNSTSFAICENNANNIISKLPINLIVSGFDKIEPGGTDYYMNSIGKIGICLECGYIKDKKSIKIAEENILAFLKAQGHIKNDNKINKQSHVKVYKKYLAKTNKFTLAKQFKNFEKIQQNQLIGIDGQEEIKAEKQSFILFAHNGNKIGTETFLLGE